MRHKESSVGENKLKCEQVIALAELVSYIEEIRQTVKHAIKLSNVVHLYKSNLKQLGGDTSQQINVTKLKKKLLAQVPDLEAHKSN